jgi:hypothetical protein
MAAFIKKLVPANWLVLEPERVEEATESTWEDWDESVAFLESQMRTQGASSGKHTPTGDSFASTHKNSP